MDLAHEWLSHWTAGFPDARQSEIGYLSSLDAYPEFLSPELQRAAKVCVWNTRPANLEYRTEKWNEFLVTL